MQHKVVYTPCHGASCFQTFQEQMVYRPGDFVLTRGDGFFHSLIRFGQTLRFTGLDSRFGYWTHAAIIADSDGQLIEALGHGVSNTHIIKYAHKEHCIIHIEASNEDREQMLHYAGKMVGMRYGWMHIASLGLSLLTGLKFNFGFDDEMICSGLVASALQRSWAIFDKNPSHITPADLARYYQAFRPLNPT